jgi:hypothetical protein
MGRRNEHAGLPAQERTHLPRVLCVHPRLEVGPEEGGGRSVLPVLLVLPLAGVARLVWVEEQEEWEEEEGEM